jgi:hypothetical protein
MGFVGGGGDSGRVYRLEDEVGLGGGGVVQADAQAVNVAVGRPESREVSAGQELDRGRQHTSDAGWCAHCVWFGGSTAELLPPGGRDLLRMPTEKAQ